MVKKYLNDTRFLAADLLNLSRFRLGASEPVKPFTSYSALLQWEKATRQSQNTGKGRKILLVAIINRTWVEWAVFAGYVLRFMGYEPVILYSTAELKRIYGKKADSFFRGSRMIRHFLRNSPLARVDVDELPPCQATLPESFTDFLGENSHSVASYHIKVEEFEEHFFTSEYHRELAFWRERIESLTRKLYDYLPAQGAFRVVVPSGLIGISPAFYYVTKNRGIDMICVEGWAQRPGHVIWAHNNPALIYDVKGWMNALGPWDEKKDRDQRDLMKFQEEIVADRDDAWLNNFHKVQRSSINDELPEKLKNFLRREGPVILCGTNVVGDSSTLLRAKAFRNQKEWLLDLLRFFREHRELNLVIRAHPDEVWQKSKIRVGDFFRSQLRDDPNIYLIGGDEDVNTYSLIPQADIGLFWLSNIGLDMFIRGKPVIFAARPKYEPLGFLSIPDTREAYFASILEALRNPVGPTPEQVIQSRYYQLIIFKEMSLQATSQSYYPMDYRVELDRNAGQMKFYRILAGELDTFGKEIPQA